MNRADQKKRDMDIACMYQSGSTLAQCGKPYGLTHQRVSQILSKYGVPIRTRYGKSGFRGVTDISGYIATIVVDGKRFHVGKFSTAEEAARAYDAEAIRRLGDNAILNFPF